MVYPLVSSGQLIAGYDVDHSGLMEARFALAVRNAIRNIFRNRRRRELLSRSIGIGSAVGEVPAHAIPDRHDDELDAETMTAFRA